MIEQSFAVRETRYSLIYRKIQNICENIICGEFVQNTLLTLFTLSYRKIHKFQHRFVQTSTKQHKRLSSVFITNTFCTAYCSEFSLRP